jgi:hypothetical protein
MVLAILDGRPDVSEENRQLAGVVMQVSNLTRGWVLTELQLRQGA